MAEVLDAVTTSAIQPTIPTLGADRSGRLLRRGRGCHAFALDGYVHNPIRGPAPSVSPDISHRVDSPLAREPATDRPPPSPGSRSRPRCSTSAHAPWSDRRTTA